MIKVGKYETKEVTPLNHKLYQECVGIMEDSEHRSHIGWSGLGKVVDHFEANYLPSQQLYNFKLPHWKEMHEARILFESDKYLILELGSTPVEYCVLKHKTKYHLEKQ